MPNAVRDLSISVDRPATMQPLSCSSTLPLISSSIAIAALSSIASVSLKSNITTSWSARSGLMTRTISRAEAIE